MRKQQLVARALWLVAALSVGSAYAGDGPTGGPPAGKGKPPAEAGRERGEHAKGEHAKGEHAKGEHAKGEHGKPEDAAAPGKDADKGEGKDKDKPHEGRGAGRHGMRELWAELKAGKLKKGDLKDRLGALREQREQRMKDHREELKARLGATLAVPAVREELAQHARRVARLDRAMVLAETEVTKDQDKLKERIQKLIDKENARHEQAMERFKAGTPAAASAAAAAPPVPATPPAVVAVEKAGDK